VPLEGETELARIKINILLYSSLKEKAGQSRLVEEIEEGTKIGEIWDSLRKKYDLPMHSEHILVTKNGEYASEETTASAGDEIALFPPVGRI
jgi:molybdopterin converting factor small subunit